MRKGKTIGFLSFCLATLLGIGVVAAKPYINAKISEPVMVLAEGEEEGGEETPEPTPAECTVVIAETKHGSVSADIMEGNVGDICTITAKHDMFYIVESASVNGTALIESETTSGVYSFALVAGENTVTIKFVIDETVFGAFTDIVEQINNKDWTNLFSVQNVITILSWIMSSGILIVIIRYFVKDKKLAKQVEETVQNTVSQIIPEATKTTVLRTVETVITPIFAQTQADMSELMKAMDVFAKCMALSQENTPESRKAILDELAGLKIGDINTIEQIKNYIENLVKEHEQKLVETMAALEKISQENKEIAKIEQAPAEEPAPAPEQAPVAPSTDDGTQI